MRKLITAVFVFVSIMAFGINDKPPTYYIPAAGANHNTLTPSQISGFTFLIITDGSVNLGGNTYTLTYASLPPVLTTWNVIADLDNLTVATKTNVNLFGETPLSLFPGITTFYINFTVEWVAGVATKKVSYFGSLDDLTTFYNKVTFNARANFNDTVELYGKTYLKPASAILAGNSVVAADTTGKLTYGCTPWCITGNTGLSTTLNFLGNTDTTALRFRVNNISCGGVDYTLNNTTWGYQSLRGNTTGTSNTAIGNASLYSNTTGYDNTSIGASALNANTTGFINEAVGNGALRFNTTGNYNSANGHSALYANTTGSNNTGVGYQCGFNLTTGSNNVLLGYNTSLASASTSYGIALGATAVASTNQFTVKGVRTISLPNVTTAIRYVLTDTSGTGDFIPQPLPNYAATTFTPVTGDSITITTSQNDLNAAGTIAVLTVLLPASPYSGQILEFSTTQIITSLLWSIRLSGGTTLGLPSTLAQYSTVKIKWNSSLSKWLNY